MEEQMEGQYEIRKFPGDFVKLPAALKILDPNLTPSEPLTEFMLKCGIEYLQAGWREATKEFDSLGRRAVDHVRERWWYVPSLIEHREVVLAWRDANLEKPSTKALVASVKRRKVERESLHSRLEEIKREEQEITNRLQEMSKRKESR